VGNPVFCHNLVKIAAYYMATRAQPFLVQQVILK